MTLRDEVWDAALQELVRTGSFRISELGFDESQRHTVRRVLKEMEEVGWVERDSQQSSTWEIGEKGKALLQPQNFGVDLETVAEGELDD